MDALCWINGGDALDAAVLEVAPYDIRCFVDGNPEIGDRIQMVCPEDPHAMIHGIVHWKELRRSGYEIGVFLNSALPSFMRNRIQGDRKSLRFRCRVAGHVQREDQLDVRAVVVNYSFNGIALQAICPMEIDQKLQFCWKMDEVVHSVDATALWQIEQSNKFLVGCSVEPGVAYRLGGLTERMLLPQ